MRTDGNVIVEGGWIEKTLPPLLTGGVIFLMTRLYDAWQFDKKLSAMESRMATRESVKAELAEFRETHITPLKDRQSKFDQKIEGIQAELHKVGDNVIRIAAKLGVETRQ